MKPLIQCAVDNAIEKLTHELKQRDVIIANLQKDNSCLLYTSPSPRDRQKSRMPSSA